MKQKIVLRGGFSYDGDAVSLESATDSGGPSLTQQQFQEECDINTIVRQFGLTGELPNNVKMPQFGDFEGIFDYQSALNMVIAADDAFMSLPADVRARFHNNPQALVEFCSKPENLDEMRKLGLAVPAASSSGDGVKIDPSAAASSQPSGGLEAAPKA